MQMSVDLNRDGGRHKAQLEPRERKAVGGPECLEGRGKGREKKPLAA